MHAQRALVSSVYWKKTDCPGRPPTSNRLIGSSIWCRFFLRASHVKKRGYLGGKEQNITFPFSDGPHPKKYTNKVVGKIDLLRVNFKKYVNLTPCLIILTTPFLYAKNLVFLLNDSHHPDYNAKNRDWLLNNGHNPFFGDKISDFLLNNSHHPVTCQKIRDFLLNNNHHPVPCQKIRDFLLNNSHHPIKCQNIRDFLLNNMVLYGYDVDMA